jgi:uncharacterized Zn finger protein
VLDEEMACQRCGGTVSESHETVPYIGPGPCVVELGHVAVRRCVRCGQMGIEVPDASALDVLVRRLRVEGTNAMPQLVYEDGRWRISDVRRDHPRGLSH